MYSTKCAALALCIVAFAQIAASEPLHVSDAGEGLAAQISAQLPPEGRRRIAILPFSDLSGRDSMLTRFLAEDLTTRLFAKGGVEIVERTLIDKMLTEIKLGSDGLVSPSTAQELGKVTGARALVTGTVAEFETFIAVNCRLIDTTTGQVSAAASVNVRLDADVRRAMGESARRPSQPDGGAAPEAASASGARARPSGLIYREIKAGTGLSPKSTDMVSVHYRGALTNGTEFESSYRRGRPVRFPVSRVTPCFAEGLQLMKVGGTSELVCPSDIAYGDSGRPPQIEPGATLVFQVELLHVETVDQ